ncbi:MAG: hypothetical protein Q4F85_13230 [Prevotella sp.]|nr:hypothetical protein [Prevotella sp.]
MNNKKFFAIAALAAVVLTGCKDKPKQVNSNELLRPASMYFSHNDSASIKELVNTYVENMRNKNFEANAELLYTVHHDSIFPYTDEQKAKYLEACSHFNFYDCRLKSLILRSDKNNEAAILVQIIKSGSLDKEEGVTTLSLNPVKIGDSWYLTLLDKYAEGVEEIYK